MDECRRLRIVEGTDVVVDGRPGLVLRRPGTAIDELGRQRREEALRDRVVPAVADAAHAADNSAYGDLRPVRLFGLSRRLRALLSPLSCFTGKAERSETGARLGQRPAMLLALWDSCSMTFRRSAIRNLIRSAFLRSWLWRSPGTGLGKCLTATTSRRPKRPGRRFELRSDASGPRTATEQLRSERRRRRCRETW